MTEVKRNTQLNVGQMKGHGATTEDLILSQILKNKLESS